VACNFQDYECSVIHCKFVFLLLQDRRNIRIVDFDACWLACTVGGEPYFYEQKDLARVFLLF